MWSDTLRLHCWYASKEQIKFLQEDGIGEFLTSNNNKESYSLSEDEILQIEKNGVLHKDKVIYKKTNLRYEEIDENIKKVYKELLLNNMVSFTHEWCFDENKEIIQKSFELFKENNYYFIF